jgi:hypothetical protein
MENKNLDSKKIVEKESNGALHFFLYMIMFLSLSFIVFGMGNILFGYINKYFPDGLGGLYAGVFDQGSVKFGIAALFVATPIFIYIMKLISKLLREGTLLEKSKVRRWLIYIVLFFAVGTIISDLITLIVYFLDGDIAIRFLLKVFVVLAIASGVFGYYFWDVRRIGIQGKTYAENKVALFSSTILVLIVFVSGFFIIDSPSVARNKKQDIQVVYDLQYIDEKINSFYADSKTLPQNLDALKNTKYEPLLQQAVSQIEYSKKSDLSYELCATFARSNLDDPENFPIGKTMYDTENISWLHESGKVCFKRDVIRREDTIVK